MLWIQDVRYAIRVLRGSPVFATAAILTLALCIGANTAIFTVVDRVLLRPLPYPEADRLAAVARHVERGGASDDGLGQDGAMWEALRAGAPAIDLAASTGGFGGGVNLAVGSHVEYVQQRRVSAGYFRVLGVLPAIGRAFTVDEDRAGGPAAVVLSHALWTRVFGADPAVVGRAITLRGEPYTVVGVMPAHFDPGGRVDVWTPARPCRTCEFGGQNYELIARLRPGATWGEARAQVAAAGGPVLRDEYRDPRITVTARLVPLKRGETEDLRDPLFLLWAAVGVVLVIGCVNIAGLLLARCAARTPEIATRLAIGGSRAAVIRQLVIESVVLGVLGGVAGLIVGAVCLRLFIAQLADALGLQPFGLDGRVLAATTAIALATGLAVGLVPALQASRVDLRAAMIEGGGREVAGASARWPRRLLVLAEVALGVVLIVGAGLLIRTFAGLVHLRPGFNGANVVTGTLSLQDARYTTSARVNQLFTTSLEEMRRIPGVEHASVSLTLPYERALNLGWRFVGGPPADAPNGVINLTYVTPEYFNTFRIPIRRGRAFTDRDTTASAPVVIVNEAFERRYTRATNPIGRQIATGGTVRTIVGVSGDILQKAGWGGYGPIDRIPAAYIPATQTDDAFLQMVHTWFSPSWSIQVLHAEVGIVSAMQQAIEGVDPLLPFNKFRSLDEVRSDTLEWERTLAMLLGALAGLALVLAGVGIYGLVATSVGERRRELGVRIALGATPRQAMAAAAVPALVLCGAGVAIGVVVARVESPLLAHMVWGVTTNDPLTFAVGSIIVLVIAVAASVVPAMRIVRLDPVHALRIS